MSVNKRFSAVKAEPVNDIPEPPSPGKEGVKVGMPSTGSFSYPGLPGKASSNFRDPINAKKVKIHDVEEGLS